MKKLFTLVLVSVISLISVNANASEAFAKGDIVASVQVGIGSGFAQRLVGEYCVVDGWLDDKASLGVGASINSNIYFNYYHITARTVSNYGISLTANCSFHYQFVDKLDTYVTAGVGAGYVPGIVDYIGLVGARYYFTDNFAVNGEVGYTNLSYLNVGVSWRF